MAEGLDVVDELASHPDASIRLVMIALLGSLNVPSLMFCQATRMLLPKPPVTVVAPSEPNTRDNAVFVIRLRVR